MGVPSYYGLSKYCIKPILRFDNTIYSYGEFRQLKDINNDNYLTCCNCCFELIVQKRITILIFNRSQIKWSILIKNANRCEL